MSFLPQRKKSHEEIAKLRESLGVPNPTELPTETPSDGPPTAIPRQPIDTIIPAHHQAEIVHPTPSQTVTALPIAMPSATSHGPKPTHSLKRSERMPAMPSENATPARQPVSAPEPEAAETAESEPAPEPIPKLVRSLRKSEQGPVRITNPSETVRADSRIPVYRHSDKELGEIRRRGTIAMMQTPPTPQRIHAHFAVLALGYILALTGISCFFYYEFPMAATGATAILGLCIAAYIYLQKPASRHHAAFIAVIALFVIIFGVLHYFPQIQHAT